jgi:quercetin dioxygenase-like cupin family protein
MSEKLTIDPDLCIIHTHKRAMISPELAKQLDPVNPATFHQYVLGPKAPVELHYHDMDEYWWFTSGTPVVTLWTPETGLREYQLEPGDMVACRRGVAHTLWADHTLVYQQFSSVLRPGARGGHLTEGLPHFDKTRGGQSS